MNIHNLSRYIKVIPTQMNYLLKNKIYTTDYGTSRFNIKDIYKFEEYEHLIKLIKILLENDCMIKPNRFIITYEIADAKNHKKHKFTM